MPKIRRRLRYQERLDTSQPRPRRIPTALLCSVADLLVALGAIGLVYAAGNFAAGLLLSVVATPPLVVLTLYFAVRDLFGPDALLSERRLAWLALTLSSIPVGLLVGLARSLAERLPSTLG